MMDLLKSIFKEKLLVDDRQPCLVFKNPLNSGETLGFLAPEASIWNQLSVLLLIQSLIAYFVSIPVYHLIVKKSGSVTAFLTGYGAIIPFSFYVPFLLVKMLDLRNPSLVTAAIWGTPFVFTLRCMEAMYGFTPHSAEINSSRYSLYFSILVTELEFDTKTTNGVKATSHFILDRLRSTLISFVLVGLAASFIAQKSFLPFQSNIQLHDNCSPQDESLQYSVIDYIHPGNIGNNLLAACYHSVVFYFGTSAQIVTISMLTGLKAMDIADNPLSKSSSISDFWGKRWNRNIGCLLRRGIYRPLRIWFSAPFAVGVTFLVSGLLHEYFLFIFAMAKNGKSGECLSAPNYGNQTLFFLWNAMVLVLESFLGRTEPFNTMKKKLPPSIKTLLVLLAVLPISHWFTHEYIAGGNYSDLFIGLPMIVVLQTK